MKKLQDYDGYKLVKAADGWGYYVTIGSTKANKMISYEYDGGCATYDELENYLKTHTFEQVVKDFREQFVYCECVEPIY